MSGSKLFAPIKVGAMNLGHRVAMAPLTRFRADKDHVHTDLAVDYYTQRASEPGTLLITEATFISPQAGGYNNIPGIWNEAQIKAWKKITDAVHAKGCSMVMQLWALGRAADPSVLKADGYDYVSSSATPMAEGMPAPRELTVEEIKQYVADEAQAAKNAIAAGFDGVELHSANGYLVDQFLQDTCNKRTDNYGGSIENRARFALECMQAITEAVGQDRVGIRLSPWSEFQGMKMADPKPTFSYLVTELGNRFPELAYLHVVESRIAGNADQEENPLEKSDFLKDLWQDKVFFTAGGYRTESAKEAAEHENTVVVMGRYFISNPDLVKRMKEDKPFNDYNRDTFYQYKEPSEGYTDYPFLN
ncbi:NADH:flavin oxidoreductase/NADH oxidase [Saitoella complicata NRRL Y-17804]|nr:NADH:flavin oxidoreductase/NADH oxidase [Saitoella complicata NRRL Y-17804]ODQ52355.1 NADH:flavin oxidoreductase/NADH oxidase [Saitoella complicata NRRL Y-17804]